MKHRFLSFVSLLLFAPLFSFATHIIGGSLTYEHLGGATYRVTFKMYRDCTPPFFHSPYLPTVIIEVRKPDGTAFSPSKNISINFPGATNVPFNIDTCVVNTGLCLEEAIYTKVVNNLPPNPGGYHLYFQDGDRNASIDNIGVPPTVNPDDIGISYYTYIPDNSLVLTNSSPVWVNPPPVFICQGQNMLFDHSANDPDGDSLAYSMYTPYRGPGPMPKGLPPTFPGNIATFTPVPWITGYGPNNPLDPTGTETVTITPAGILNGIPPFIGEYVFAVKCEEFRNGVKIGEILRDLQVNVVYCPPVAVADFTTSSTCVGTTVTFNNNTNPLAGNTYNWNFGDTFTSSLVSPTHAYAGAGPYTVTLISNPGTACADTATQVVTFSTVTAAASSNAPQCAGSSVAFTDGSTTSTGSITGWSWNFGDPGSGVNNTSSSQNPTHTFANGATYTVTLTSTNSFGCTNTFTTSVTIQSKPIANAGLDTSACTNNPVAPLGGAVFNATGGIWIGNGAFAPSNTSLSPTYTATAAEVTAGVAIVGLITTGNGVCVPDTDWVTITIIAAPTVNAGADVSVCKDTSDFPICATATVATGGTWTTSGTGTFNPNANVLCPSYIPSSADTTAGTVTLVVTTTGNGACSAARDTLVVTFYNPPTSYITSTDSFCAGTFVPFSAISSTGTGVWSTSGTGTFSPSNTSLIGFYTSSAADNAAGSVVLTFTSTNNGGCQAAQASQTLTLIPSPTAAFTAPPDCAFLPTIFTDASTTTVGSIASWNWNFGDPGSGANNTSTIQNPTHTFAAGGAYNVTLIVTSTNGCIDTLVQPVNVLAQPGADFVWDGACLNELTSFTDSSSVFGNNVSWTWNFGDLSSSSSQQNPLHLYTLPGAYGVTLIVTSNQGCIDTIAQVVNVNQAPTAVASVNDNTPNTNTTIFFNGNNSITGIVGWNWSFGDSTFATGATPSHSYSIGGTYNVMLIVTDANGCMDTTYLEIIVSLPPLVPTGFSPNGDGKNDMLFVKGGPYKELEFRIYNNWGELIFTGTRQQDGWNGQRNGKNEPTGVYVYTIKAVLVNDTSHELHGDVTLLR